MTVYVTFGQWFARETHPVLPNAHPDGWYEMELTDLPQMQRFQLRGLVNDIVYGLLGSDWSNAYIDDEFIPSFHPLGKLGDLR